MNKTARRVAVIAGLVLSATAAAVSPSVAADPTAVAIVGGGPERVHVQGEQIPVDATAGTYVMQEDLVGDWLYIPRTPPLHSSDTLYVEAGTEVFNGCIDRNHNGRCGRHDTRGQLRLAFIYWASYDLEGNLIKGQCVHPITGGDGAFAGARGRLDMVDRPVGDEVKTTYRGTIILNAVPSERSTSASKDATGPAAGQLTAAPLRRGC